MSETARTSVVIATRNRRDELLRTLARLRELAPRPPVVVVDNASDDGTPAAVRALFPEVQLIANAVNRGAAARNAGVRAARTPYVAFCDDDSWWEHDSLAQAEKIFDAHPSIGLVAARTTVGRERKPDPVNALMSSSPLSSVEGFPGPRIMGFTACAAVVRREAFQQVGGFSSVLFFVAEEKLLALDLAAAGWDLAYADGITAHHQPSNGRSSAHDRRVAELRNNLLIDWLRRPAPRAFRSTAELVRKSCYDASCREAVLGALGKFPTVLRNRRRLPASTEREVSFLEQNHQW